MIRHAVPVHILDDRRECRESLKQRLAEIEQCVVTAEYASYEDALAEMANTRPVLLVVEIGICNGNGMEFVRKIRLTYPNVRILVFTHHDEQLYAERALRVGAHGYVMKEADPTVLKEAVLAVLQGALYVSPAIEEKILRNIAGQGESDDMNPENILSNRELEIFFKIGKGLSSRDIATQLALSIKTVETHRAHIKRKLNIRAARDLLHQAADWVSHAQA